MKLLAQGSEWPVIATVIRKEILEQHLFVVLQTSDLPLNLSAKAGLSAAWIH